MSSTNFQSAFRAAMAAAEPSSAARPRHWQVGVLAGGLAGVAACVALLAPAVHWLIEALLLASALGATARWGLAAFCGVLLGMLGGLPVTGIDLSILPSALWEARRALVLSVVLAGVLVWRHHEREQLRRLAARQIEGQGHRHQMLNTLLMANQDSMSLLDRRGRVLAINHSGVEQMQFETLDEAVGEDWLDWWPESQRREASQRLQDALGGVPQRFECDCPSRRGAPRSWDVQLLEVRGPRGSVCAVLSIWRDISAAKQALRQAREARDAHAELLLRIDDAFLALDVEGSVVFANKEAEETLGSAGRTLVGESFWRRYPQLNGSELQAQCLESLELGDSRRLQFFFKPHQVWLNVAIYPSEHGVALLLRDVTEQVRGGVQIERHQTRMRLAQEIAGFGDWEYDVLQGTLSLGDTACRLLGVAPGVAEAEGQRVLLDAVAPEQRAEVLEHLLGRISSQAPIDVRFRRAGSEPAQYLWLCGRLTEDEAGRLRHVVGTLHDVTESTLSIRQATRDSSFFRAVIDALPQHVCVLDSEGTIISTNRAWDEFSTANGGVSERTSRGASYLHTCVASASDIPEAADFLDGFERVLKGALPRFRQTYSLAFAGVDGPKASWYEVDLVPMQPPGEPRLLLVSHSDISAQHDTVERLAESEQRFRELAECLPDAFFVHELKSDRLSYLSPSAERLPAGLGQGLSKLLDLAAHLEPESQERWLSLLASEHWYESSGLLTLTLGPGAGEPLAIDLRFSPVRDRSGNVVRVVGLISDVSERQRHAEQLQRVAMIDELTQLPNRLALMDAVRTWSERADGQHPFALILINIDDFSSVNESLGHAAGDRLLVQVVRRLFGLCAQAHVLARLGSDEFALLVDGLQRPDEIAPLAEELRRRLDTPFCIENVELVVSACVGSALYPLHSSEPDGVLRCAALALESAKQSGAGGYAGYADGPTSGVPESLHLKSDLMRALDRGEFELVYQPKFSARELRLTGVEALLRWRRRGEHLVSPGEFIPLLERSGAIVEVGAWVLHAACEQARRWRASSGVDLSMAVNVSARQMHDGRIVTEVASALTASGLEADCLELEITETALMRDPEQVVELTGRLRALGSRIALDDFGTRFSSLNYLHKFAPEVLKIDKCFIDDVDREPRAAAMINALIQLGHGLDMQIVAEGVERESQLRVLQGFGCDLLQGFLLSRPLSIEAMDTLLAEGLNAAGAVQLQR